MRTAAPAASLPIAAAFFLSGFAALVYQLAWQRLLFVMVGVDIESVTIIVSTFMLGLGLGAVLGGWLADRWPTRILLAFCIFEAAIALYGLASVDLLQTCAALFAGLSRAAAATLSFGLLILPTICMGATLPMLVAHAWQRSGNVGVSTGALYFVNTLGAACGAFAIGFLLLYWMDLRQAVWLAAGLNGTASLVVAGALRRRVA